MFCLLLFVLFFLFFFSFFFLGGGVAADVSVLCVHFFLSFIHLNRKYCIVVAELYAGFVSFGHQYTKIDTELSVEWTPDVECTELCHNSFAGKQFYELANKKI